MDIEEELLESRFGEGARVVSGGNDDSDISTGLSGLLAEGDGVSGVVGAAIMSASVQKVDDRSSTYVPAMRTVSVRPAWSKASRAAVKSVTRSS